MTFCGALKTVTVVRNASSRSPRFFANHQAWLARNREIGLAPVLGNVGVIAKRLHERRQVAVARALEPLAMEPRQERTRDALPFDDEGSRLFQDLHYRASLGANSTRKMFGGKSSAAGSPRMRANKRSAPRLLRTFA